MRWVIRSQQCVVYGDREVVESPIRLRALDYSLDLALSVLFWLFLYGFTEFFFTDPQFCVQTLSFSCSVVVLGDSVLSPVTSAFPYEDYHFLVCWSTQCLWYSVYCPAVVFLRVLLSLLISCSVRGVQFHDWLHSLSPVCLVVFREYSAMSVFACLCMTLLLVLLFHF